MLKRTIAACLCLTAVSAIAHDEVPPSPGEQGPGLIREIEEECGVHPGCGEEQLLCVIDKLHQKLEAGEIDLMAFHNLLRMAEMKLAFHRGLEEGRLMCQRPKPPIGKPPGDKNPSPPEDKPKEKQKVEICHVSGNSGKSQTIRVAESAVQAHLNHGDSLGPCADDSDDSSKGGGSKDKGKSKEKGKQSGRENKKK